MYKRQASDGTTGIFGQEASFGPYNIADGNITITVTSDADPTCQTTFDVVAPATCSDACLLTAVASEGTCNDNGTDLDPMDDTYTFTATIDGIQAGTSWTASDGSTGTFGVETTFGPYNIADGNVSLIITADADASCETIIDVIAPESCSDACQVTATAVSEPECNDNGTDLDPTDDIFTFTATIDGIQAGTTWTASDGTTGIFGQEASFGPYNIVDGNVSITITADADGSCEAIIDVVAPETCSDACLLTAVASEGTCNDNGTDLDPTDDTFTFTATIEGIQAGTTWTASDGTTGTYGVETTFGPFDISDGDVTIIVNSDSDEACEVLIDVIAPETCSEACSIEVEDLTIGECNNNGTGAIVEDDFFSVTFSVESTNLPSDATYTVRYGDEEFGPYTYNEVVTIENLPADGSIQLLEMINNTTECFTTIEVSQEPCSECNGEVDIDGETLISCDNPTVTLSADVNENADFIWNGPNGITFDGEEIQVSIPGKYYVTAVFAELCEDIDSIIVTANEDVPVAVLGDDQAITCLITEVTLDATGSSQGPDYTYEWRNPDGDVIGNELTIDVTEIGVYTFKVINTASDCATAETPIEVIDNTDGPTAVIYADPNNEITCIANEIMLFTDDNGNTEFSWVLPNGRVIDGPSSIMVDEDGMVTLTVLDIITGCTAEAIFEIADRVEYPLLQVEEPEDLTCAAEIITIDASGTQQGENIIYSWYDSTGNLIQGEEGLTLDVVVEGTYIFEAKDTLNGCVNSDTIEVESFIRFPEVDAGDEAFLNCVDNQATINATLSNDENGSIRWIFEGSSLPDSNRPSITVNEAGFYYIEVTNGETGCVTIDSVQVSPPIDVLAGFTADPIGPLCFGESSGMINISDIDGGTAPYSIFLNGRRIEDGVTTIEDLRAGFYTLEVVDAAGCSVSERFELEAADRIEVDVDADIDFILLGETITLNGATNLDDDEIASTLWTPEDVVDCPECLDTDARPIETTQFTFTVTDTNGCTADASITIRVDRRVDIYVPNIFTPNDDGENDLFTVYTNEVKNVEEVTKLLIFDRWGNLVFMNENFQPNLPELGWDGVYNGTPVNPGVFAYLVEVELIDGTFKKFAGDVTVLR